MTINHILVIHHGALGDIVTTFSALIKLKKLNYHTAIVCQSNIGQLVAELQVVDRFFPLEAAAFATLYSNHVDSAVKKILPSYPTLIPFSNSRSLEKTLFSITGNEVYRIQPRPAEDQKIHITQHILSSFIKYRLFEKSGKDTNSILSSTGYTDRRDPHKDPLKIFLHPGSGSRKKCWPVSNFIEIASAIHANGKRPEFILGPAEYDLSEMFLQQKMSNPKIHTIETLTELAGLLKTGGGFIGNDSGVSHLAAFLGLPTVTVFGPSDPEIWKPIGRAVTIVRPDIECSPCFETGKVKCKEMECFNRISPEDVLTAFYGLVG